VLTHVVLVVAGVTLLAIAGDRLVEAAAALARRAHVTPAVVGLTIVAAGTSAPELFVSVTAALSGSPEIALANVVGSNIANVGLILGGCALIAGLPVARSLLRREYPILLLVSAALLALGYDGRIGRGEGLLLLVGMLTFLAYSVRLSRIEAGVAREADAIDALHDRWRSVSVPLLLLWLATAIVGLALGARWLVGGATGIALAVGMSERVVGLTLVAVGTSLPEFVASAAAAMKRQPEMAVANVVGSNIFNVLFILGATAAIEPLGVARGLLVRDIPVMLASALLLVPLVRIDGTLTRRDGLILCGAYLAYLGLLARTGP
jgi:cation:H+ antiporter